MARSITVVPGKNQQGDQLWALGNGVALFKKSVPKTQPSGPLYLCTCTKWEWSCTTHADGSTFCTQECVEWDCKEVPAK